MVLVQTTTSLFRCISSDFVAYVVAYAMAHIIHFVRSAISPMSSSGTGIHADGTDVSQFGDNNGARLIMNTTSQ
jgi:hypothetical protein